MSYTKPCNKCGQRISLRQMPAGQWVAFDVSTEDQHICGVQNAPDISIKIKGKKVSIYLVSLFLEILCIVPIMAKIVHGNNVIGIFQK